MDTNLLARLRAVDTPTVCNAIEVAQGKRGFNAFSRGTMLCSAPDEPPLVGYARTAKIAAISPPSEPPDEIRTRRMAYYRYMAQAPGPSVCVIEDTDYPDCVGAFWGELNTTVHKGFGMSGTLTNGVMRDLGDLPIGYPVIAGSLGPSHAFVHVKTIDCEVEIHGLRIRPGDLIHADQHGALVIPAEILGALGAAIDRTQANERIVLDAATQDGFDFDAFDRAWSAFERARV